MELTKQQRLQILRTLDKSNRIDAKGIFELLTIGRKDKSGDFTPGCGLSAGQALILMDLTYLIKITPIKGE